MPNTNLKIIIFLYLISLGLSDLVSAEQKFQRIDHFSTSPQVIDFIYGEPIDGIRISGRYTLNEWEYDSPRQTYWGKYRGSAEVTFTRLSDMRSITEIFDDVSFLNTYHCLNKEPIYGCLLEYPLSLEPIDYEWDVNSSGFLPDVGLNIIDYDYDDKNEIIIIMPFEYRGGPEFLIYELIDTSEEFNIGIDSPSRIPSHVEFDYENKIMNYSYSNGAWDSFFYSYKADTSDGYKLISENHTCDFIDYSEYDTEQKKNIEEWCLVRNK
jgi:hypothetical protein